MVTIQEFKRQPDRAVENCDAAVPHLPVDTRETSTEGLRLVSPCSRCGNVRPLTHRVRSDVIDQIVCEVCAAEVPLVRKGIGALTVERIIPIEKSSAARATT